MFLSRPCREQSLREMLLLLEKYLEKSATDRAARQYRDSHSSYNNPDTDGGSAESDMVTGHVDTLCYNMLRCSALWGGIASCRVRCAMMY